MVNLPQPIKHKMAPIACFKFLPKFCPYRNVMYMMKEVFSLVITPKKITQKQTASHSGILLQFHPLYMTPRMQGVTLHPSFKCPIPNQDHALESYLTLFSAATFPRTIHQKMHMCWQHLRTNTRMRRENIKEKRIQPLNSVNQCFILLT